MNKNTSNIHLDILDKARQKLLIKLIPVTKDFILGGGTALSLQLAHRKSFDFDFFTKSPLHKGLLETLSQLVSISNVAVDTSDELTFFTHSQVKITLLHYPFGHSSPVKKLDSGLVLFSVEDIAIQKAYTIGRRGEYRDYFDLYAILKNDFISLPVVISEAKKIYGTVFEEKIFLQQLVYFGDLLNFDIVPASSKRLPKPEEVKRFFEDLVKNYV